MTLKPVSVLSSRTESLEMFHEDKDLRTLLEVPVVQSHKIFDRDQI